MILTIMFLTCLLWGFVCRDIKASWFTLVLGGTMIGVVFHFIEKLV